MSEPMNLEASLDWERRQELRYEFDEFAPVAMTGGCIAHPVMSPRRSVGWRPHPGLTLPGIGRASLYDGAALPDVPAHSSVEFNASVCPYWLEEWGHWLRRDRQLGRLWMPG
jgi:hypothetical protein